MEANDVIILSLIIALVAFVIFQRITNARYKIGADDFKQKMKTEKKPQLIDVRAASEYKGRHIGNAFNINVSSPDFNERISKFDKKRPVFVYCASGMRSARAAKKLAKLGFAEIYDLKGGINAWED